MSPTQSSKHANVEWAQCKELLYASCCITQEVFVQVQQCVEVSKETTCYFARLRGMLQIRTVAEPCLDRYLL